MYLWFKISACRSPRSSTPGCGVGALPRLYLASYTHANPLFTQFPHGNVPVHFIFLALQTSHALLTFGAFRLFSVISLVGLGGNAAELRFRRDVDDMGEDSDTDDVWG